MWWILCNVAGEGYAVNNYPYHQGFSKIIMYCGRDEGQGRFGVRHVWPHTPEYQFAVDKTAGSDRAIRSAEDWQDMTIAGVLLAPQSETAKGPVGNCATRSLALNFNGVEIDRRVYQVGWWDKNDQFLDRVSTAFPRADGKQCAEQARSQPVEPRGEAPGTGLVYCGLQSGGCFMHESAGSIYKSDHTLAVLVKGAIRDRFRDNGWELGPNRYPTSQEFCGLRAGGCGQRYDDGLIYWSSGSGAWSVHGATGSKFAGLGWETGFLQYPTTNEFCRLSGGGCGQHYQGGSIYWSPGTGPWSIRGIIRDAWAGLGWERSWLGYPISDEVIEGDGLVSKFQNGFLYWSPATGVYGEGYGDPRSEPAQARSARSYGTPPSEQTLQILRNKYGRP